MIFDGVGGFCLRAVCNLEVFWRLFSDLEVVLGGYFCFF